MAIVLMPLPNSDFDPTESGVPWLELVRRGHAVRFATPQGGVSRADPRMLDGTGLGPWKNLLRADRNGRAAYSAMSADAAFLHPWSYQRAATEHIDGLILPGGHAPGMREYLESAPLRSLVAAAFARGIPVGAICHGVLVAARTQDGNGRSVLFGKTTTALTRLQELAAWTLTPWLGNYYRTYPTTVQAEVTATLADPSHFVTGPPALLRDSPERPERGFVVRDGNYLSARWPGDAHRFATEFASLLETGRDRAR
ncbi:MAG TPA: type 1 glutamine amidotransferase domain-containing protein [Rudaea sp.]|nr:type 1 glutamine amidotransferase domain-containing protein [Rudaea sp.]